MQQLDIIFNIQAFKLFLLKAYLNVFIFDLGTLIWYIHCHLGTKIMNHLLGIRG